MTIPHLLGHAETWWDELVDPPEGRLEIIDGELVMTPGAGELHQEHAFNLCALLRVAAAAAGLDARVIEDHEWRSTEAGVVAQAPRPDVKVLLGDATVPYLSVEVLSPADHTRFQSGLTRIEGKRIDYARRGVSTHLEVEVTGADVTARHYVNHDGILEPAGEATGQVELIVTGVLPFRFVPNRLRHWFDDTILTAASEELKRQKPR